MKLEPFKLEHHMTQLAQVLSEHGHSVPTPGEMPLYGYAVVYDDVLVATAFLRRVEGGFVQLDGLCTNPSLSGEIRNEGIELALKACYDKAIELGYKNMYAMSIDNSTLLRSINHGFVRLPHVMIAKDLTGKV